ncbi:unnamed protein product [Acanthosepion pharaonis]|uniref:SSD domain-containing protein n=1 Tax=Acanthosepion pharaonis TaxID=158019 RepID=A0A812D355_ACAPH|nr:unnamed protein product [Sepia pharaonis]
MAGSLSSPFLLLSFFFSLPLWVILSTFPSFLCRFFIVSIFHTSLSIIFFVHSFFRLLFFYFSLSTLSVFLCCFSVAIFKTSPFLLSFCVLYFFSFIFLFFLSILVFDSDLSLEIPCNFYSLSLFFSLNFSLLLTHLLANTLNQSLSFFLSLSFFCFIVGINATANSQVCMKNVGCLFGIGQSIRMNIFDVRQHSLRQISVIIAMAAFVSNGEEV